jgi:putative endonuclease
VSWRALIVVGMTQPMTRGQLGALGEQLAVDHLTALGWQVLDRNWRCRWGELDVVAVEPHRGMLVFVEVKTRSSDRFGGVEQAVTPQKVRRLRRLAGLWLSAHRGSWAELRIDVVGIRVGRGPTPELIHLEAVG